MDQIIRVYRTEPGSWTGSELSVILLIVGYLLCNARSWWHWDRVLSVSLFISRRPLDAAELQAHLLLPAHLSPLHHNCLEPGDLCTSVPPIAIHLVTLPRIKKNTNKVNASEGKGTLASQCPK